MKDIDGYVTKDNLYRLISRIKRNPDFVIDDKTCDIIIEAISDMSKADVQPIKHGRWIGITEYCKKNGYIPSGMGIYYWCSECGKEEQKTSDFCPNCGARMDGEQNDNSET